MTFITPILSNSCGHCGSPSPNPQKHLQSHFQSAGELRKEERDLHALPRTDPLETDPFEDGVGNFWKIYETRSYMRARFGFVDALGQVGTRTGIEASLEHLMDMLRLCRGDNMGVRDIIPGLMLRLGKDQECYDFAKWWRTRSDDFDWGNMDLPYLDIRNADSFEDVGYPCKKFVDVSHVVAVVLVKIRLLLDLNTLQNLFIQTQGKSPDEIQSIIQQPFEARSFIVASMEDGWKLQNHSKRINMIESHIRSLIPSVNGTNRHLWKKLVNGQEANSPGAYAISSPEEAEFVLLYSRMLWIETPGAIEVQRYAVRLSVT